MAKRKAARRGRKQAGGRKRMAPRRKSVRRSAARKKTRVRAVARRAPQKARAAGARKVARSPRKSARKTGGARAARRTQPKAARAATPKMPAVARKMPALNRERRTITDDDLVPTPPSSLDLDRSASAARTGRRELHEKFSKHTETSPAITGGDIDADWESAYSVGDEAPGGDNPTPDQDIVDEIGRAVGVQYEDNEELKGDTKIAERDRKRWELDPASSEDYNDR